MSALTRSPRHFLLIALFGLIYACATALVSNSYYQLIMTLVPVWAVMGLSWNLLSGYSGLVSFGHAAFFGLGAYCVALLQIHWNVSPWLGIPVAGGLGALAGLLVGVPTFRLRGHYFALAMLAYPLALLYLFEWAGYQEVALPMQREAPIAAMQFEDRRVYAWLGLGLLLGAMVLTRYIERSRFGRSLLAIKQDEAAAEASGINALAWKLKAITLSAAMAATVGGFYAVVLLVVTPPAVFGMLVSAQALIVAMFGGVGTLWGPVIGAVILVPLSELLHARLGDIVPGIQGVVYGLAIVAVILVAPEGVFWKIRDWLKRRAATTPSVAQQPVAEPLADDVAPRRAPDSSAEIVLRVRGLSKSFGGLTAVQDVQLDVRRGEIVGIIGPNGAGKTTLFNLLNGFVEPDAGEIVFEGRNFVQSKPYEICAAGIGRTFQVVRPFRRMSVEDNVSVGAYVHTSNDADAQDVALQALARVGLHDTQRLAGTLSNKELRLLELARALAGKPKLLLLDETLAGLGSGEVSEVLGLVRTLAAQGITIVIIEHTMSAMVRLVDRFVVLDHGAVLAEGTPETITQHTAVIDAYLGQKWRLAKAHA